MSKKKGKRIESETREVLKATSAMIKASGDRYKFRKRGDNSKKDYKRLKCNCMHWYIKGSKDNPMVYRDPDSPGTHWRCICGARFPIAPPTPEETAQILENMLGLVNQAAFLCVELGGNGYDTKVILRMKETIPLFKKVLKGINKAAKKRQQYEESRKKYSAMSQFDSYSGFSYRP